MLLPEPPHPSAFIRNRLCVRMQTIRFVTFRQCSPCSLLVISVHSLTSNFINNERKEVVSLLCVGCLFFSGEVCQREGVSEDWNSAQARLSGADNIPSTTSLVCPPHVCLQTSDIDHIRCGVKNNAKKIVVPKLPLDETQTEWLSGGKITCNRLHHLINKLWFMRREITHSSTSFFLLPSLVCFRSHVSRVCWTWDDDELLGVMRGTQAAHTRDEDERREERIII